MRSRPLAIATFLLVMTTIGAMLFTAVFKDSTQSAPLTTLEVSFVPGGAVLITQPLEPALRARLVNQKGFGVSGKTITLTFQRAFPIGNAQDLCAESGTQ